MIDQMLWTRHVKQPASALLALTVQVDRQFNVPSSVKVTGISIDVSRNVYAPYPVRGNMQKRAEFMDLTLANASYYEARVLSEKLGLPAQSTVTLFQRSRREGQTLYTLNRENRDAIMPLLGALPQQIRDEFVRQTNLGNEIITPAAPYSVDGFNGVAYVSRDPRTLAGGWMIGKGAGGMTDSYPSTPSSGPFNKRASFCYGNPNYPYYIRKSAGLALEMAASYMARGFHVKYGRAWDENLYSTNPNVAGAAVYDYINQYLDHSDTGGIFFFIGHANEDSIVLNYDYHAPMFFPPELVIDRSYISSRGIKPRMVFLMGCNTNGRSSEGTKNGWAAAFGINYTSNRHGYFGTRKSIEMWAAPGIAWYILGEFAEGRSMADIFDSAEHLGHSIFSITPYAIDFIGDGNTSIADF